MTEARRPKVLAIASGGGHWVQLRRMRPAWDGCDVTYVTTSAGYRDEVMADAAARGEPAPAFAVVIDANRWQKLRLLRQLWQLALIVLRLRPDTVVTTGAAPGYFALRLGRLVGARTVWIDSIANAEELSLSGRAAGRHADLWLTQWPHLASAAEARGPGYRGAVL
ncbi:MAG: UDP-N-acetylglucosamine--LPS N-acetylglucosamine transferase [Pseudomonadota bacterium]